MKTTFGSVLAELRKGAGKMTQQQLAEKLGVERGAVANYESKGKLPHIETLIKIADLFNVSLDHLLGRETAVQARDAVSEASEVYYTGKQLKILPIAVDKDDTERITLVPLRAAAGYLSRFQEVEYIRDLPTFNLPNFTDGTYRAFEVEGDSMKPTIHPRDIVVCKYVENWYHIKDNHVYTVLGAGGIGIVVKRLLNRIKANSQVLLRSDNDFYPEFELLIQDIHEVWEVKGTISTNLEPPYYLESRFRELRDNMSGVFNLISKSMGKE
ncbi:MAG: LexA family transcriptional regulator [Ferruginibacter sp.]|nr:LexA family transcriptional regulator [Cytophagales bacterium]